MDFKTYKLWDTKKRKFLKSRDVTFYEDSDKTKKSTVLLPLHQNAELSDLDSSMNSDDTSEFEDASAEGVDDSILRDTPIREVPEISEINIKTNEAPIQEEIQHTPKKLTNKNKIITEPVRRSERNKKPPSKLQDYECAMTSQLTNQSEPKTYKQAISCANSQEWKEAMNSEYNSILSHDTWELVDRPYQANVVGTKWTYKLKETSDGETRYKARLVAQGFKQIEGIDYQDIFSPVARYSTIRMLFAYATQKDLKIRHLDVVTAFLHSEIDTEIFVAQPLGFVSPGNEDKVCRLKKAIYGLKQASRTWYFKLESIFESMKLVKSKNDPCLCYLQADNKYQLIVIVFVDDMIVFYDHENIINWFIGSLKKHVSIKDLGPVKKLLGINVVRDPKRGTIKLHQEDYIKKLLKDYNMDECTNCSKPIDPGMILQPDLTPKTPEEIDELKKIPYQNAIGSLMYLLQATRPDIAYAVSLLSRFNNSYNKSHWSAVKNLLRYVKGTSQLGLTFTKNGATEVFGYCDASYASDKDDYKSVTGYVFLMQGSAISWRSKKQSTVAKSSTEAELQSLSDAVDEALWLKKITEELKLEDKGPTILMCDNKSTIEFSKNSKFSHALKHVNVKYHSIKEKIDNQEIELKHVPTNKMVADMLTKAVGPSKIREFVDNVGLSDL